MFDGHENVEEGREAMSSTSGEVGRQYLRHRGEVQAMARAIAAGWSWYQEEPGHSDRDRFELECREIAHAAAFLVGAVDDELDGRA